MTRFPLDRACPSCCVGVLLVSLFLLLPASELVAQRGAGPAAAVTSATARVDQIFAQWDRADSPGCVVGVYRDGRIAYARGYGMANLELNVALTPQSVLDIGSTSKQFTAMSIVLLQKAGKLSLDDDIRKYVPEVQAYGTPITIRNVLNHVSGIRDYITLWDLAGSDDADLTTEADALDLIARQREPNFAPGEEYLYSNSGFFLAGIIIKRVSGQTLAAFERDHIFQPLGMSHTRVNDDHMSIIPNRATGYSARRGAGLTGRDAWATDMSNYEQVGDGGVTTTIEDLQKWDENFYTGTVGGKDGVALMQVTGTLNNGQKITYALGLTVEPYRGLPSVSHGGSWAGYRAELLRFPDQHFSVAAQCNNSVSPGTMARHVADIYLGDLMKDDATPAAANVTTPGVAVTDAALAQRVAGPYVNAATGEMRRVAVTNGALTMQTTGAGGRGGGTPILQDGSVYRLGGRGGAGTAIAFEGGTPPVLKITDASGHATTFARVAEWTPTAADLAMFAGLYYGEEIDQTYEIKLDGTNLVLHRRRASPATLRPLYADTFSVSGYTLRFIRDKGRPTLMFVDAGRTRNLRFVRR